MAQPEEFECRAPEAAAKVHPIAAQAVNSIRQSPSLLIRAARLKQLREMGYSIGQENGRITGTFCHSVGCGACGGVVEIHHNTDRGAASIDLPDECPDKAADPISRPRVIVAIEHEHSPN